jgi:hypothetical protein
LISFILVSAKAAEEAKAEKESEDVTMDTEESSAAATDDGKVKILGLGRGKKGGKVSAFVLFSL